MLHKIEENIQEKLGKAHSTITRPFDPHKRWSNMLPPWETWIRENRETNEVYQKLLLQILGVVRNECESLRLATAELEAAKTRPVLGWLWGEPILQKLFTKLADKGAIEKDPDLSALNGVFLSRDWKPIVFGNDEEVAKRPVICWRWKTVLLAYLINRLLSKEVGAACEIEEDVSKRWAAFDCVFVTAKGKPITRKDLGVASTRYKSNKKVFKNSHGDVIPESKPEHHEKIDQIIDDVHGKP